MDLDNDLVELGMSLVDAKDSVRRARDVARRLLGDYPENYDPGWPAMGRLIDQLDAIRQRLEVLPGDEIDVAIDAAEKVLDGWADKADGQSY